MRDEKSYRAERRNAVRGTSNAFELREGSKGKSVEAKRVSPRIRNRGGDFKTKMREIEKHVLASVPQLNVLGSGG